MQEGSSQQTWREMRLYGVSNVTSDPGKRMLDIADGVLREGVTVKGEELTFDFSKIYPDDAVAVLRDLYTRLQRRNPRPVNDAVIEHLNKAIYDADRDAVKRHGYSFDEKERTLPVPY